MASFTESPGEARGRRDLSVAVVFFVLSLVVLYLPEGAQSRLAATFRSTALRPFLLTQEILTQFRMQAEDAKVLQARLDSLAASLVSQAPLVEENRRLHELLGLRERAPRDLLPASVIRPGTPGSESMFLLDVGVEQGVGAGDPVIVREGRIGLVGVVQEARRGSAIGLDWSHPEFRVSAMTGDGSVFGMVKPWRGLFREQDRLVLDGTPYYEELAPGTLVVTSGLGGVYPRGIPIGVVDSEAQADETWRRSYWLRPVVEMGGVTHALVVLSDTVSVGMMELFSPGNASDSVSAPGGTGEGPPLPRGDR